MLFTSCSSPASATFGFRVAFFEIGSGFVFLDFKESSLCCTNSVIQGLCEVADIHVAGIDKGKLCKNLAG